MLEDKFSVVIYILCALTVYGLKCGATIYVYMFVAILIGDIPYIYLFSWRAAEMWLCAFCIWNAYVHSVVVRL